MKNDKLDKTSFVNYCIFLFLAEVAEKTKSPIPPNVRGMSDC
jgi:hypothetical protein